MDRLEKGDYPVPSRFAGTMPDDLRPVAERNDPAAWKVAEQWLLDSPDYVVSRGGKRPGHSLVLHGPVGTGKTAIAAAWVNFIEQVGGYRVGFVADGLLAKYFRLRLRHDDVEDEMAKLEGSGYLVVDDLFRQGSHRYATEIEYFLRTRCDNGFPTIVTVNNGVELPEAMHSYLKAWDWAFFEGVDLRDPENT